jgi:hypothetical protein
MRGHREPFALARDGVHERSRRRMERRAAEPANEQQRREHEGRCRRAERAQHEHGHDRTTHEQHARPPPIRERAEAELRHRARQLVTHGQYTHGFERQVQLRNEKRQERRKHVAVRVNNEVR